MRALRKCAADANASYFRQQDDRAYGRFHEQTARDPTAISAAGNENAYQLGDNVATIYVERDGEVKVWYGLIRKIARDTTVRGRARTVSAESVQPGDASARLSLSWYHQAASGDRHFTLDVADVIYQFEWTSLAVVLAPVRLVWDAQHQIYDLNAEDKQLVDAMRERYEQHPTEFRTGDLSAMFSRRQKNEHLVGASV